MFRWCSITKTAKVYYLYKRSSFFQLQGRIWEERRLYHVTWDQSNVWRMSWNLDLAWMEQDGITIASPGMLILKISFPFYIYSGDPNTGHSDYGTIRITDFYSPVFKWWKVRYSNHHLNTRQYFVRYLNGIWIPDHSAIELLWTIRIPE